MIRPGAGAKQIQIFGVGRVLSRLTKMEKKSRSGMVVGLQKCLFIIERESVKLISFGDLRAVKTGRLRSTIGSGVVKVTVHTAEGWVYAGTEYAAIVHQGWGQHSRARPFIKKAALNKATKVITVMGNHMKAYLNVR